MSELTVSCSIDAPAEQVWALMSDIEHAADRLEAIRKIEMLTEGPVGVGTKWRETRVVMKREATEAMEIRAFDPPRSYTVYSDSCGCDFHWSVRVEPAGAGCTLTMDVRSKARTFMAKLMTPLGWMMKGVMRKCMQQDLDEVKAHAEHAKDSA